MRPGQESSNKSFSQRFGSKTGNEFIDRIKEGTVSNTPVTESEDTFFGLAIGNTQAISFRIDFQSGEQYFIQYHELTSPFKFDGSKEISLETPALIIKVIGRNLNKVFEYLGHHRLGWLKEPVNEWMDKQIKDIQYSEPVIEKIKVEEKDG
jgi:hypothetical protein